MEKSAKTFKNPKRKVTKSIPTETLAQSKMTKSIITETLIQPKLESKLETLQICIGITKYNVRCKKRCKVGDYCGSHIPNPNKLEKILEPRDETGTNLKEFCERNTTFSHLLIEWDTEKNGPIENCSPHSGIKRWWRCSVNPCGCHVFEMTPDKRTSKVNPSNCPFCKKSKRKVCEHDNLEVYCKTHPEYNHLLYEWDRENIRKMSSYAEQEIATVKWVCRYNPCGCHKWSAPINIRTGKDCRFGTKCPYCLNIKLCAHNNLKAFCENNPQYAYLINQWCTEKNKFAMTEYSRGSSKKVYWKCPYNNHPPFQMSPSCRTGKKPQGCPYCSGNKVCYDTSLEAFCKINEKYCHLLKEWSDKNTKSMSEVSPGSDSKFWWNCPLNPCGCHVYQASPEKRTRKNPTGCPHCAGKKLCDHKNLEIFCRANEKYAHLENEWDKSNGEMKNFAEHSGKIVKWICTNNWCGCHKWEATISDRTRQDGPINCPFCVNQRLCAHNNLQYYCENNKEFSHLLFEWDAFSNLPMTEYPPGSDNRVTWICLDKRFKTHIWKTRICDRTNKNRPTGCPFCNRGKPCPEYNLELFCQNNSKYAHLMKEWNHNLNHKKMSEFSPHCHDKVHWKCQVETCGNEWYAIIKNRTAEKNNGCPKCNQSKGEKNISEFLKNNGIIFETEKRIHCNINVPSDVQKEYELHENLNKYRYDFYLPKENCLIEFDGIQHFEPLIFFNRDKSSSFEKRRLVDIIKTHLLPTKYAIIRIDYTFVNKISIILPVLLKKIMIDKIVFSDTKKYEWIINCQI